MKLIIFAYLVAVSLAAPKPQDAPDVAILRDERVDNGDGNFNYAFELDDGTSVSAAGTPTAEGAIAIRGSYKFTLPDGVVVEITYIADENGFQPQGDVIPKAHSLPAHSLEQIQRAAEVSPEAPSEAVVEARAAAPPAEEVEEE